jgi:hypothetical protein
VLFTKKSPLPALEIAVGHVFLMRTQKEVGRLNARAHVAFVANMEPIGDRSVSGEPRRTMRKFRHASAAHPAIAGWINPSGPKQTPAVGFGDAVFFEAGGDAHHSTELSVRK